MYELDMSRSTPAEVSHARVFRIGISRLHFTESGEDTESSEDSESGKDSGSGEDSDMDL